MTQTTDTLSERLEALLAKAVSGTWRAVAEDLRGGRYWSVLAPGIDDYVVDGIHEDNAGEATAALIVEAVNALPTLLSALRSTAKEVEAKDPGTPFYEAARFRILSILRSIGRNEPRSGFVKMADDLEAGDLMQIPAWVALQALGAALATSSNAGRTVLVEECARDALAWFATQQNLELFHYSPMFGDDHDDAVEWRVTSVNGGYNDREWTIVGRGDTPLAAVQSARAALTPADPAAKDQA